MTWKDLPIGRAVVALLGVYMLVTIVQAALAPPASAPRPQDLVTAARAVEPAEGVDERFPRPPGDRVAGNGVVEPADREIRVAASVGGRIAEVVAREGDVVRAGDVLVRLESAVEAATLAAAEGDAAAAEAELRRLRAGTRRQEVDAARHELAAAEARAASAEDAAARQRQLAQAGQTTDQDATRARLQAEADRAASAQAAARLRLAEAGARDEEIAAAEARLTAARARRDEAAARLAQREVRAPVDGTVLQVLVRAGEQHGTDAMLVMGDTSTLRVRMDVDERDIARIRAGAPAIVRAIAFPGQDFVAHVSEVGRRMGRKNVRTDDPVERNDTRILEVVVTLDPGTPLVVGQRVTVYALAGGAG